MNFIFGLILFPLLTFAELSKKEQFDFSLRAILSNATRADVRAGLVVASPSKSNPDYYYDWVRDTALTYRALIDYYELYQDQKIKRMIFTWIEAEAFRQNQPTFSGLGEPKYFVDGSGYTGGWGRPQNDGPALRAISMIKFARLLLKEGNQDYVLRVLYHGALPASSVIKKDLEYTAHEWMNPSFDLWEEEKGLHFYTLLAQHTALSEGAKLARELGDGGAATFYEGESKRIGEKIKSSFVDKTLGLKATIDKVNGGLFYKTSNLDVAPLLALLHNYPYQKLFSFSSSEVARYLLKLRQTFKDLYLVNKSYPDLGVSIGRYPEDRYDGYETSRVGNPWFLTTLALAEYYCLLKEETGLKVIKGMGNLDDLSERQFQRALFHSDREGKFSEQFNQNSGYMQGAPELTWSHSSFVTAMMKCQ